jgi:CheY-like chemotaxis protein
MQGVVGMLDVMYATVMDAVETQTDPKLRKIFEDLKENIEVVQDSSRRAVEAADNVVHAYDMDMSVPDAPPHLPFDDPDSASPFSAYPPDRRPEIFVAGSNLPLSRKRRRDEGSSRHTSDASTSKFRKLDGVRSAWYKHPEPSQDLKDGLQEAEVVQSHAYPGTTLGDAPTVEDADLAAMPSAKRMVAPGLRHTDMQEVIQYVINEGLKLGGRPDSALTHEKEHGEVIEVRSRGSDGSAKTKIIDWSVDPNMPHTLWTDEKDLSKLISCVFLNAIKFTDQEGGHVAVHARLSSRGRYVTIKISDNGPGIPAAFLPKLFKPFSRENESITRQSEGLGLGLMVAKGIARKLGGDLMCTRAETEGPDHGSEFEIKVPVRAGETISRPSSPFGSPMPRGATLAPLDVPKTPPFPPLTAGPRSPSKHAWTLHDIVTDNNMPSTPPSPKSQPHIDIPEPLPAVTITSSPPTPPNGTVSRPRIRKSVSYPEIDRDLANKYPLKFLVAEDNKINRKLLVSMLNKFGYKTIHEAHDGVEAVRRMNSLRKSDERIDVVLMDLWMPLMDGYEAAERILKQESSRDGNGWTKPTVLAVTADVTDGAQERAARVGMKGFMTKPYKMQDLQRLITEYCAQRKAEVEYGCTSVPMIVEG